MHATVYSYVETDLSYDHCGNNLDASICVHFMFRGKGTANIALMTILHLIPRTPVRIDYRCSQSYICAPASPTTSPKQLKGAGKLKRENSTHQLTAVCVSLRFMWPWPTKSTIYRTLSSHARACVRTQADEEYWGPNRAKLRSSKKKQKTCVHS